MAQTDRFNGLDGSVAVKIPVKVRFTTALTLAGEQTIDGVACTEGDRVLRDVTATPILNGVYVVSTGDWTRAPDFDGPRDIVNGTKLVVSQGTWAGIEYTVTTADPITIGTSEITFASAQISSSAAQTAAEAAQAAAETAQGLAETAQTAAETAQGLAETAQTAAEAAQTAAEAAVAGLQSGNDLMTNPDIQFAQERISKTGVADGDYLVDGFKYTKVGAMVHDFSIETSNLPTVAQAGFKVTKAIKLTLTTPDTSIAATDHCTIVQPFEGQILTAFSGQRVTLQFWVNATATGAYSISFQQKLSGTITESFVSTFTVSTTNTWERKTLTFDLDPATAFDTTNLEGMRMNIVLAAGSNFHSGSAARVTGDAWTVENKTAISSAVNGVDTGATTFMLTGFSLRAGSVTDTVTSRVPFEAQWRRVTRQYRTTYNRGTLPGTVTSVGSVAIISSGTSVFLTLPYQEMRATPTITAYSTGTGASGKIRDTSSSSDLAATVSNAGENNSLLTCSSTDQHRHSVHATIDARM